MKLKFNINLNVVKSKNNLEIARRYHHYDNVESMYITLNKCACPFNDQDSMCGHLGAVIMKLNELEINDFPFEYQSEKLEKMKEIEKENQRQRRKAQLRQLAHTSSRLIDLNKNHYQTELQLSINNEKYDLTPFIYLQDDEINVDYRVGNEEVCSQKYYRIY